MALLTTARSGTAQATHHSRPLARIWTQIGQSLDGTLDDLTGNRNLVWLPAHQTTSAIQKKVLSNGRYMTTVDWRANRLVDALARSHENRIWEAFSTIFPLPAESSWDLHEIPWAGAWPPSLWAEPSIKCLLKKEGSF